MALIRFTSERGLGVDLRPPEPNWKEGPGVAVLAKRQAGEPGRGVGSGGAVWVAGTWTSGVRSSSSIAARVEVSEVVEEAEAAWGCRAFLEGAVGAIRPPLPRK